MAIRTLLECHPWLKEETQASTFSLSKDDYKKAMAITTTRTSWYKQCEQKLPHPGCSRHTNPF